MPDVKKAKTKTGVLTTRLDATLIAHIDQQARAAGLRRNDIAKMLIVNGLQQTKAPAKFAGVQVN